MKNKIWKDINNGYKVNKYGVVVNKYGKVLKQQLRNGYLSINVNLDGTGQKRHNVHRLMCIAFYGEIGEGLVVNHKDGNKRNNRLDNLEITTQSGNIRHSFKLGFSKVKRGEQSKLSKMSETDAISIITMLNNGSTYRECFPLLRSTGTESTKRERLRRIKKGLDWRHLHHLFN